MKSGGGDRGKIGHAMRVFLPNPPGESSWNPSLRRGSGADAVKPNDGLSHELHWRETMVRFAGKKPAVDHQAGRETRSRFHPRPKGVRAGLVSRIHRHPTSIKSNLSIRFEAHYGFETPTLG